MNKNGEDSPDDNVAQMFLGVRFVLMGFDPVLQLEIRSKLINGGGVDAGEYGPSCTHVIVDKIVFDDSVCIAARNDGKILVTGLWVEHSFDIGMPVDASLILYRPLKDLNGIPGAKSLFVCLTGYQRQDREDIMKMVGMMGAQFSKPLIANKVTHLICYKFEGEKYELAKKMKEIKLVNHRWLEDCLRAWQILPEDNYDKSTYELEMMEAEAKDSEEETGEDYDNRKLEGRNVTGGPFGLINGTPRASKSPMPRGEVLEIHPKNVLPKDFSNVAKDIIADNRLLTTPGKDTRFDKASYFPDVNERGLEDFGCQGNGAPYGGAVSGRASIPSDTPSKLTKECNGSTFNSRTAPRSPYTDAEKLITSNYSRKTPTKTPVSTSAEPSGHTHGFPQGDLHGKKVDSGLNTSLFRKTPTRSPVSTSAEPSGHTHGFPQGDLHGKKLDTGLNTSLFRKTPTRSPVSTSAEPSGHTHGFPQGDLHGKKVDIGLNTSLFTVEQAKDYTDSDCSDLNHQGRQTETLPQKRKLAISGYGIKSPHRGSHDPKTCASMSPSGGTLECLDFPSMMIGAPLMKTGLSSSDNEHCLDAIADVDSVGNPQNGPSMMNSLNSNQKTLNRGLPLLKTLTSYGTESPNVKVADVPQENTSVTSMGALKSSKLASEPDIGDVAISRTADLPADKKTGPQKQHQDFKWGKSKSPISFGMHKGANDEGSSRSLTKEMVGLKSLGSRRRLSTNESNTRKGFFSFDKTETPNGATVCPMMITEGAEDEQKVSEKHEMCWPTSAADVIMREIKGEKAVSLDDETEAPEDKDGDSLEKPISEMVKPTNAEKLIHKQPKRVQLSKNRRKTDILTMDADAVGAEEGKGGTEHENALSAKKTGISESTFTADTVGENTANGGKHPPRNTKKAVSTVTGIKTSEKGKNGKEPREGKVGAELDKAVDDKKTGMNGLTSKADALREEMAKEGKNSRKKNKGRAPSSMNEIETSGKDLGEIREGSELMKSFSAEMTERENSTFQADAVNKDMTKGKRRPSCKTNRKVVSTANKIETSDEGKSREETKNNIGVLKTEVPNAKKRACPTGKTKTLATRNRKKSMDAEKENKPIGNGVPSVTLSKRGRTSEASITSDQMFGETDLNTLQAGGSCNIVRTEPVWFIVSGHHLQRKEFQQVIRRLKGRVCRDSHHWSYQATHFIVPDPVRRTEKFFAAAASGRWILKTDYLTASNQAGKLLPEEPYEWYRSGLSEDGAINLEAPRKWRLLRERTGHGAFYGMCVVIYGECIAPPLDTLKRVLKAGGGTILATSPPYTRFLKSGVDFAIVSPGMPRVDLWVQEFLRHEIPCVLADYLVEYVCRPGCSLERHVLYNTYAWAEKSFANLLSRSEEIIETSTPSDSTDDLPCQVCGTRDRGEVMMICGDESGSKGCGIGMHIDCCDPPLEDVPEEDWFCLKCSKNDGTRISKGTKKKKRSVLR